MKEEDMDKRIERAVRSVAPKRLDIARWENDRVETERRRRVIKKRWLAYGIPAAASVAVIAGIGLRQYQQSVSYSPNFGMSSSSEVVFRGGSHDIMEIEEMIDSGKYDEALKAIGTELADTAIDEKLPEEQKSYIRDMQEMQVYDLEWLKVQTLVKQGKRGEALKLLKEYTQKDGAHREEALKLLKELTEQSK